MSRSPIDKPAAGTHAPLGEVHTLKQPASDLLSQRITPLLEPSNGSRVADTVATPVPHTSSEAGIATPEAERSPADKSWPERLDLTRGAPQLIRRHLSRAVVRISVLLAGDALALLGLRWILQGARDLRWFGQTVASVLNRIVPPDALPLHQFLPAVLLGLVVLDTYGASDRRRDDARLIAGVTFGLVLPFWGYLWEARSVLAVPGFLLLVTATAAVLMLERYLIDRAVRILSPVGHGVANALLVGRAQDTTRAMAYPVLADTREFSIRGVLDPDELQGDVDGSVVSRLSHTIKRYHADTLVLTSPLGDERFAAILDAAGAAGCQVFALTRSFFLAGVEPKVVYRRGVPLVALTRPGLRARQLLLKRTLDIVGAGLGIVLLAPVFAAIALAVKLSSSGPIFFRQQRVGRGGTVFMITKFRSMVEDAESRRGALAERSIYPDLRLFKVKEDPRVTWVGTFLRRSSLDELPQLLDVLRGEMSLVGPRPPLPSEVDLYEEHHYTRFDMKPGMTGPWQVSGRNSITDFEEVIRLETAYIREWAIWKDLAILVKTVPVVFTMRGAH
jgi:exopolysaccharide biosynthesis polyprenyl glycosylphosphotransferase